MKKTFLALAVAAAASCGGPNDSSPSASTPSTQSATPSQTPDVDAAAILERIKVLAADEYEGRAPGTRGEELTVRYLVEESKKLGLQPGNPDGTFVQKVPLVGITGAEARPFTVTKGGQKRTFKWSAGNGQLRWSS